MNKEKSKKAKLSNEKARMLMPSKKGAEMTIGTLVVIVLAILVLVLLALGFGVGWTNLWSKITGYFSPVNVDVIKQACTFACTSQSAYDYCCQIRDVRLESSGKAVPMTCYKDAAIKPSDCSLTCTASICGNLVCAADNLKTLGGKYAVTVCKSDNNKVVDSSKKLKEDLSLLNSDTEVCCKAAA